MIYSIQHETKYVYSDAVVLCQNQACLHPGSFPGQTCESFALDIVPEPLVRRPWTDYFGNRIWYFAFDQPHEKLIVTARSRLHRDPPPNMDLRESLSWDECRYQLRYPGDLETRRANQFVAESPYVRHLTEAEDYARSSFPPGRPLLLAVSDLTERIFSEFEYDPTATVLQTPTVDVLRRRRGVCQDFAHLQICCLRSLGLAARYVSGYLLTDAPPGGTKLVGADASHAWISVYSPGRGWIDFDPTNNCLPQHRHLTAAWGRDYGDVAPIRGIFVGGGRHTMSVAVDVVEVKSIETRG